MPVGARGTRLVRPCPFLFAELLPHHPDDLVRMEGLLQSAAARDGARCSRREACGVDDAQFGIGLAAALRDLPSVDLAGKP